MAKIVTEKFVCDVCKSDIPVSLVSPKSQAIQVIFNNEQTEGRSCKPYLSSQHLDLCKVCQAHMLEGNYIFGSGAMGHNTYNFKESK